MAAVCYAAALPLCGQRPVTLACYGKGSPRSCTHTAVQMVAST